MAPPKNMTLQDTVNESTSRSKANRQEKTLSLSEFLAWPARILVLVVILASPWMIGSVQHWAQYWLSLGLLLALGFWWFETAISHKTTQVVPYVATFVFIGLGIGLLQTVSLSDSWASSLLGRQLELYQDFSANEISSTDGQTQIAPAIKRISLDSERTWHMIRLLVMAVSALLLGCRYFRTRTDLTLLYSAMTINGVAISFFGMVQKLTFNGMLFWRIELTQGGTPFGPFVNRNNSGGFLLICLACAFGLMSLLLVRRKGAAPPLIISKEIPFWRQVTTQLLYFISELTATKLAVLIAIVFISSGVVATLSRGAVLAMISGGLATLVVYGVARRPKNLGFIALPMLVSVVALTTWIGFGQQLIERFENKSSLVAEDARIAHWTDTSKSVGDMGVFGSGLGAYRSIHRFYRSDREDQIFQYAENQYFQALVDAGWPGLITFLGAWVIAISCMKLLMFRGLTPSSTATGIMAVFLLSSQSVASFFDFGFYIAANMLNLAVMVGVLSHQAQSLPSRIDIKSWLGCEVPNFGVSLMIGIVFGGVTMVALDLHRKSNIDVLMRRESINEEYDNQKLVSTQASIEELGELVNYSPSAQAANRLGDLWVQRARLNYLALLETAAKAQGFSDASIEKQYAVWWSQTNLTRIYEHELRVKETLSELSAKRFLENDFIQVDLPKAKRWYQYSIQQAPLQPWAHIRIGQINIILDDERQAYIDFERAVRLAPMNPKLVLRVAHLYLANHNLSEAAPHLKKYLELIPREFGRRGGIMDLLTGLSDRRVPDYDAAAVLEKVVPNDPTMLFAFALRFANDNSSARTEALNRAVALLKDASSSKRENIILLGKVYQALNEPEQALEQLGLAIRSDPGDDKTRFLVANIQLQEGMLDDALENAVRLVRHDKQNRSYKRLKDSIQKAIQAAKDILENQRDN